MISDQMADDDFDLRWLAIEDLIGHLRARSPLAETAPLIDRARGVASDDPAAIRQVADHARRLGHHEMARELRRTIPASIRCGNDDIQLALDLVFMGRFAEARRELEAIDRAELSPHEEALLLLNWVPSCVLPCALPAPVDEEELVEALARTDTLLWTAHVAREINATAFRRYSAVVDEGRGLLALYCGRVDEALTLLEKAHAGHPDNPWIALALGEAFAASGDHASASDCWRSCADGAHPESFLAKHALERLRCAPYR